MSIEAMGGYEGDVGRYERANTGERVVCALLNAVDGTGNSTESTTDLHLALGYRSPLTSASLGDGRRYCFFPDLSSAIQESTLPLDHLKGYSLLVLNSGIEAKAKVALLVGMVDALSASEDSPTSELSLRLEPQHVQRPRSCRAVVRTVLRGYADEASAGCNASEDACGHGDAYMVQRELSTLWRQEHAKSGRFVTAAIIGGAVLFAARRFRR